MSEANKDRSKTKAIEAWRLGVDVGVEPTRTGPQEAPETAEFDEDGNQIFRTREHYETAKKAEEDREFVRDLKKERKKVTIHSHKRDPINE